MLRVSRPSIFTYKLAFKIFVIKNIYFEAIIFILFLYSIKIQLGNNTVDLIFGSANPGNTHIAFF